MNGDSKVSDIESQNVIAATDNRAEGHRCTMKTYKQSRLLPRLLLTLYKLMVRLCCRRHLNSSLNMENSIWCLPTPFTLLIIGDSTWKYSAWYWRRWSVNINPATNSWIYKKWPGCRKQKCHGSTKLVEVTNQYKIKFKTHCMRYNLYPIFLRCSRTWE